MVADIGQVTEGRDIAQIIGGEIIPEVFKRISKYLEEIVDQEVAEIDLEAVFLRNRAKILSEGNFEDTFKELRREAPEIYEILFRMVKRAVNYGYQI